MLENLEDRRRKHRLTMMHRIKTKQAPTTLQELLPETASERHSYNTRQKENLTPTIATTTILQNSFFYATPMTWNALPPETKSQKTTESFKQSITQERTKVPEYYNTGLRKWQILQTRIRLNCSDLNKDLYKIGIKDSEMCDCGYPLEDAYHYLLKCKKYNKQREEMLKSLNFIENVKTVDLLYGNNEYSLRQNVLIFQKVQKFIESTTRFK